MSSSHKDIDWDLRHTADLRQNIERPHCREKYGGLGRTGEDYGGGGEGNITVILTRGEHHESVTPTIIPGLLRGRMKECLMFCPASVFSSH